MPESLEQLDLLLLTIATPRKVQRDGISLHGLRYFSTTLAAYIDEPVTIRYDPRDLAEIRVYHRGEYLCRAVAPDIATATVSMKDLQAARNQRRRELRQHLTARRDLLRERGLVGADQRTEELVVVRAVVPHSSKSVTHPATER